MKYFVVCYWSFRARLAFGSWAGRNLVNASLRSVVIKKGRRTRGGARYARTTSWLMQLQCCTQAIWKIGGRTTSRQDTGMKGNTLARTLQDKPPNDSSSRVATVGLKPSRTSSCSTDRGAYTGCYSQGSCTSRAC